MTEQEGSAFMMLPWEIREKVVLLLSTKRILLLARLNKDFSEWIVRSGILDRKQRQQTGSDSKWKALIAVKTRPLQWTMIYVPQFTEWSILRGISALVPNGYIEITRAIPGRSQGVVSPMVSIVVQFPAAQNPKFDQAARLVADRFGNRRDVTVENDQRTQQVRYSMQEISMMYNDEELYDSLFTTLYDLFRKGMFLMFETGKGITQRSISSRVEDKWPTKCSKCDKVAELECATCSTPFCSSSCPGATEGSK